MKPNVSRRAYRRKSDGTCCQCHDREPTAGQRMCARCFKLYKRFWRLKNKSYLTKTSVMLSDDDWVKLGTLGVQLIRLSLGFKDEAA